jgi:hypothetical protein
MWNLVLVLVVLSSYWLSYWVLPSPVKRDLGLMTRDLVGACMLESVQIRYDSPVHCHFVCITPSHLLISSFQVSKSLTWKILIDDRKGSVLLGSISVYVQIMMTINKKSKSRVSFNPSLREILTWANKPSSVFVSLDLFISFLQIKTKMHTSHWIQILSRNQD